ncbi:uncharacterized protein E5676_scaffold163G001350 [Cucumis melo var. makuwa]|uniref:RNase H type-1 domain-containing protein n=1 Tax=Cucumis melo var. makuwa TaxID=1194695 RepID=A0A5D3C5A6_CUCMM|nr:uncharacterized protein E5676_scaffold163G001350 [Cucumis melo var. makuwa]
MPPFEVAKNIWEQISKPLKGGVVIKENPAIDEHNSLSERSNEEVPQPNKMSVMVTDVDTSEYRMAELEKKVNMLMKAVEERDFEIALLKNHIKSRDAAESSHTHTIKNVNKGKAIMQESQPQNSTSIASLSVQQLQEMIANSIKIQYGGPAQMFSLSSKPYTKRIDNMRMPHGYQPPKFQQFDGKGNPKQHVAHFIETCETFGTRGDFWEQLERDFLNRFYSTRRIVSMIELTATKQQKGLATRAHDMELSIANRRNNDLLVSEVRKEKKEVKSTQKVLKGATKEAMVISTTPLKLVSKEKKMEKHQDEGEKRRPTLKERQEKIYPFPDSDLPDIKIELELDDVAQINHAAVIIQSDSRLSAIGSLIQFGSLEPVVIYSSPEDLQMKDFRADGPKEEEKQVDNVEEGWTLDTIIKILKNDDVSTTVTSPTKASDSCCMSISFSDEDLLLGSKLHNRPLYVSGYVREQKLNQILIDNGSAVNILSKSTMNQLGISVEELSNSKLVIQGFNQGAQRAIGTVRLEIVIGDLQASTIFHVIDSRTTYKMLLGHPWIHENGIVTSTLHQCFKFYKQGIRKVDADSRPFTKAESHFADAKFYTKSEDVSEIISTEVLVTKGTFKNEKEMITSKKSNKGDALNSQQNGESTTETKLRAPEAEKIATLQKKVSNPPVLRYIPLSRRKKGESPFAECSKNLTVKNTEILKENFTAPLTKIEKGEAKKIKKKNLEAYLLERRTVEGFDPKAYKLMAKTGYDFTNRTELKSVKIFDERPELSPTQKKLQKQGYSIPNSRVEIGYQSFEPVRITGKGKAKVANTCHITVEESKDSEEGKKDRSQRSSVFDRIAFFAIRPSVFQRVSTSIAKDCNQVSTCSSTRLSAFQRLNTNAKKVQSISPTPTTRKSTFKKLCMSITRGQKKASISVSNKSSLVTGDEEIRSAFPSRMKRNMFVLVNTEGSLKVKRHDVVFTRPEDNEPEDEVDVAGCCQVTIEEISDHDIFEEDAEVAPLSLEDGGQSTIDELKEVNLGTKEEPRPTFISTQLSDNDENEYVNLLKAYKDVFAWSYKEMPGLEPKVTVHRLAIKPEHRPVKQAQRRFRPDLISQIKEEVNKLIEAGFIREVKYPTLIANIVPVRMKNGQLRATYQRAMQRIFDDMLHKHIECYVDDLVVKSKKKCDHLKYLKLVLDRLRKYQLRMNPLKCAFGVTSWKFLGFIVRHHDIEVDHSKIDAIQKMPSPKNLHELRRLQGRLAYIRRFISILAGRCQPFQKLMRKDAVFDWDQSCQNAFDSIKKYLLNPSVLSAPAAEKSLILYIAVQETSLEALLAQENDKGKECALYYLSRTLTGAELNYSPFEKMSVISGHLAKWAIILQQYDILYIPQKAVKGQALADFLADHPVPLNWKLCDDLPDEEVLFVESMEPWIMFFDGATRRSEAGVGIVFISPEKHMLSYSFTLGELCSNNVVEYQAFIIGLQMASEFGIKCIEIFGDSKLIINQLSYQYEVKHQDLKPYFSYARRLMDKFDSIILEHIPRSENKKADALANLATALTQKKKGAKRA